MTELFLSKHPWARELPPSEQTRWQRLFIERAETDPTFESHMAKLMRLLAPLSEAEKRDAVAMMRDFIQRRQARGRLAVVR